MDPAAVLPGILGFAVLLPLLSFFAILVAGPRMGPHGKYAAYLATAAIGSAAALSFFSLIVWLSAHGSQLGGGHTPGDDHEHSSEHEHAAADGIDSLAADGRLNVRAARFQRDDQNAGGVSAPSDDESGSDPDASDPDASDPDAAGHDTENHANDEHASDEHASDEHASDEHASDEHAGEGHAAHHGPPKPYHAGSYYLLGQFGKLRLEIGYYIDSLTVCMFCMVTLIATLIHCYAMGYMHDELHDFTDPEITQADGSNFTRPGRYHRFFQALSLFCFSMLGLVLAGNIAMVFVFWELVGICSYFLIGFYVERQSASNAANKAFIVNRVGDFGMIIGLMALWLSLGTFAFGDQEVDGHVQPGMFSLLRPAEQDNQLIVPDQMVLASSAARTEIRSSVLQHSGDLEAARSEVDDKLAGWRTEWHDQGAGPVGGGYWLLVVAGVGIFCGCVGKSAQFPLHVWLPDAMEGPTPVSALVHSATMVAAGVYLVGRFFPVFAPEVLFVIAITGVITLFLAATIAITATDIKRVLAYSTVSQLGYMMLALGVGGWVAGLMHLITHAFFKSLLFMCSGSVIHAVHTNEMPEMGGLWRKMPVTAFTMLVGCLAIAGVSVPFVVGFSGYYSKDMILEQAFSFMKANDSVAGGVFFWSAAGGAAITAFYMFRLWYMTFAGKPRNQQRYDHAHESPKVMYVPLIILAVFAVTVAWSKWSELLVGTLIAAAISLWVWNRFKSSGDAADDHAHDSHGHDDHGDTGSGRLIYLPLQLTFAVLVIGVLYQMTGLNAFTLESLLEQARPDGTAADAIGPWLGLTWPNEHFAHEPAQFATIVFPVTTLATLTALGGIALATVMYGFGWLNPADVRKQFAPIYNLLLNKWWFDELYDIVFVKPTHLISGAISGVDRKVIDWLIDSSATVVESFSRMWTKVSDGWVIDNTVDSVARFTYDTGRKLRGLQTGSLRQYVMFIVIGAVLLFGLVSVFWNSASAAAGGAQSEAAGTAPADPIEPTQ